MRISAAAVHRIAEEEILHRSSNRRKRVSLERFSATFGCSLCVAAAVWNRLDKKDLLPEDMLVKHLLWSLSFLKLYNPERAQAPVCGGDEKTFRKWVWIALEALAELHLVSRCHWRRSMTEFSSIDRSYRPCARLLRRLIQSLSFAAINRSSGRTSSWKAMAPSARSLWMALTF